MFVSFECSFLFHLLHYFVSLSFAWMNLSWEGSIPRVACRLRGKGEGSYPSGGVGYLRLACLSPLATRATREFVRGSGRVVLSVFEARFFAKNGTVLGRMPPVVAPEGDLVFEGKPSRPF
jgi:hypothetical protein